MAYVVTSATHSQALTKLTTSQHKPGVNVGNDAIPEFSAQTLPPGSAPASNTHKPNNISDVPPVANYRNDNEADSGVASATSTLGGSTSGDVNTGLGKPMQGQTSAELRHDGQSHRKAVGGGGVEGLNTAPGHKNVDPHAPEFAGQRALDSDVAQPGQRGTVGGAPAEERVPETATGVAAENSLDRGGHRGMPSETGGSK